MVVIACPGVPKGDVVLHVSVSGSHHEHWPPYAIRDEIEDNRNREYKDTDNPPYEERDEDQQGL